MDRKEFSVREILAGQAPKDAAVTVKGWVRTRRDSKAGISFVHLSPAVKLHDVRQPCYKPDLDYLWTGQ